MSARTLSTLTIAAFGLIAGTAIAGTLSPEQQLGRKIFLDTNLSLNRNQACTTCHSPEPLPDRPSPSFVDPTNVTGGASVSLGSVPGRSGLLNTPTIAYAAHTPAFHYNAEEGLFAGGFFLNGRAATLEEQAQGPFLNPDEMAMPSGWAVVSRMKHDPEYLRLFRTVYGLDLESITPCAIDSRECNGVAPEQARQAFEYTAQAIVAFERTPTFSPFTSKYDYYLAGKAELSEQEQRGLELFGAEDKGNCAACHPHQPTETDNGCVIPPMLTDYTYDNLGLPRNVSIPGNPQPDPGLGGNPRVQAAGTAADEQGKHKVSTLRNIAITPPYGHNGVFRTLAQVVHFYNTRDTKNRGCTDSADPGFGDDCWPAPEISANVNKEELGDLDLSTDEETAIVAFLKTVTDGYRLPPSTVLSSLPKKTERFEAFLP